MNASRPSSILLMVTDSADREMITALCTSLSCEVDTGGLDDDSLHLYESKRHDLVILEYGTDSIDTIELFDEIRAVNSEAVCLLLVSDLDQMRTAKLKGVFFDIIKKPFCGSDLKESISVALEAKRGASKSLSPIAMSNRMDKCVALLGSSSKIANLRSGLREMIALKQPISLAGSKGIGKPYIARFIHENGGFANSHFFEYHCKDFDDQSLNVQLLDKQGKWGELLNRARGGTLVLHNVERFPLDFQRLFASHFKEISSEMHLLLLADKRLDEEVCHGTIDDKLYFEISLCELVVPNLSERTEDLDAMVRYVAEHAAHFGLPFQYDEEQIDLMVAELSIVDLKRNVDELIERMSAYGESFQSAAGELQV
jgi:DNA-binding NtrC family response regulator